MAGAVSRNCPVSAAAGVVRSHDVPGAASGSAEFGAEGFRHRQAYQSAPLQRPLVLLQNLHCREGTLRPPVLGSASAVPNPAK